MKRITIIGKRETDDAVYWAFTRYEVSPGPDRKPIIKEISSGYYDEVGVIERAGGIQTSEEPVIRLNDILWKQVATENDITINLTEAGDKIIKQHLQENKYLWQPRIHNIVLRRHGPDRHVIKDNSKLHRMVHTGAYK